MKNKWTLTGAILLAYLVALPAVAQQSTDKSKCQGKVAPACCPAAKKATCPTQMVMCAGCGEIKGGDKCCQPDAAKCDKCGLNKGSIGLLQGPQASRRSGQNHTLPGLRERSRVATNAASRMPTSAASAA